MVRWSGDPTAAASPAPRLPADFDGSPEGLRRVRKQRLTQASRVGLKLFAATSDEGMEASQFACGESLGRELAESRIDDGEVVIVAELVGKIIALRLERDERGSPDG